ncbi:MAG: Asp23/Gls24 family envelope stress response protein [Veillonella sp.]|uniref:Asp23/Gls24 family envelope stress response protein n=1 Tax=Veillonella sp. TaxID=1926307 RepID=UPI0025E1AA0C|nr:Asp23/Gls24 family envelope stress response protein [Veillonella sp.]MBS4912758.1 Asp23/Gls24 family envelope stress response protein [Veillonella sp.]
MSDKSSFFDGATKISDSVYTTIAALRALEVRGISSMSTTAGDDIANLVGIKNQWEGVRISRSEDQSLIIDLYVVAQYGYRIPDVALRVQEHVKSGIVELTGSVVEAVNIYVQEIVFEDIFTPMGGVRERGK